MQRHMHISVIPPGLDRGPTEGKRTVAIVQSSRAHSLADWSGARHQKRVVSRRAKFTHYCSLNDTCPLETLQVVQSFFAGLYTCTCLLHGHMQGP